LSESAGGDSPEKRESTATKLQLELLSKQLEKAGFSPLHPSLLYTSKDNAHFPGTLTDTQGLCLISTLSVLINEFENRGSTIQSLVQQLSQKSNSPTKAPESVEIQELKAKIQHNEYVIDKLKFEASSAQQRQESQRIRNERILESVKQEYGFEHSSAEPVIARIIDIYEDKLSRVQQEVKSKQPNPFEDLSDLSSPQHSTPSEVKLQVKLDQTMNELNMIKKERDMLQLQLINEQKSFKRDQQEDLNGLSTRDLIQRDKKQWKLQNGDLHGLTHDEMRVILKDVCNRLGITDYDNVGPCIEKIQMVVKLIPQMEQFIREVNSTVLSYSMKLSQTSSKTVKLTKSLETIREWAELAQTNTEYTVFHNNVAIYSRYS
jgi:hypothetical protein